MGRLNRLGKALEKIFIRKASRYLRLWRLNDLEDDVCRTVIRRWRIKAKDRQEWEKRIENVLVLRYRSSPRLVRQCKLAGSKNDALY